MQAPVDRQFYSFDSNLMNKSHFHTSSSEEKEHIVDYVADSIIGKDKVFSGPYGFRSAVFLDWIASGRSLSFIEDYIQNQVLPEYGNTHTTTSVTSLQTTLFRHEARDIIRNVVNASEHDSVIFTGNGSTGAIHKLIHALELSQPPVVFVGPYEHHSNLLPWREMCAEVVRIKQTDQGLVDISHLEEQLQASSGSGRQLIGSFSAASNVTGILSEVDAITVMLHKHGALALWDYATAAPYVRLDMNPVISGKDAGLVYKDAMFFSPHKFVGGVSTPGVLVVKKKLFENTVPEQCGGGTVFYVRRESHRYLREPELREEGGTPDIVGAIRAGLVLQLKSAITPELIMEKEHQLCRRAVEAWSSLPGLVILGNLQTDRLPVFSFLVHHSMSGLFLHHNYISALLNDLFGIQARGGCACAGPYAMDLLGLTEDKAAEIEELLAEDGRLDRVHLRRYMEYSHREILRPGFTRLNLPFFLNDQQLHFVLQAVAIVAEHGWKLLPQYMFNPETGEWRHREHQVFKERKWLGHISYAKGHMQYSLPKVTPKGHLPESLQACLEAAREIFNKAEKTKSKLADHTLMFDEDARPYRWFLLPSEANQLLSGHRTTLPSAPWHPSTLPFCPPDLRQRLEEAEGGKKYGEGGGDGGGSGATLCSGDCGSQGVLTYDEIQVEGGIRNGERTMTGEMTENVGRMEIGERAEVGEKTGSGEKTEIGAKTENGNRTVARETTVVEEEGRKEAGRKMKTVSGTSPPACNQRPCLQQPGTGASSKRCIPCLLQQTTGATLSGIIDGNPANHCETFFQTTLERGYGGQGPNLCEPCQLVTPPNSSPSSLPVTEYGAGLRGGCASTGEVSEPGDVLPCTPAVEFKAALNCLPCVNGQLASLSQSSTNEQVTTVPSSTSDKVHAAKSKKKNRKSARGKMHAGNGAGDAGTQNLESCKKEVVGTRWFPPPKDIFKPSIKALESFSMIKDGDGVLVCLSGGKDSLSLLHAMHQYQFYCRSKGLHFKLGAVTVDPQTPSYDPSPLKGYLAELGVPYFYESQGIMESAINLPYECASICSFCSRMKRGRIYAAARREGYNVLALGQHLDDLAESFLMSLFHNGSLRTMKAHYTVKEGDLRVIRPLVYVREKDLRQFAEKNKLPVIAENCPACFEAPKERHRIKQLLASQEILHPHLYSSILSAIRPVMALTRAQSTASTILTTLGQNQADDFDDFDI